MFRAYNINNNTLSLRNIILLFLTIVLGFASVITLAQLTIPSEIDNSRQTIWRITITNDGTNNGIEYRDFNYDGIWSTYVSGLQEEANFSWKVLGIDDAGNLIYVLSENLIVSGTSAWENGYWTGNGTNIYNTNTGNIGIGTNNPQYKLHIMNSWSTDVYIEEQASGMAANLNLKNITRTWAMGWDSNPDIFYIWEAGGAIDFSITPSGNVGIGTTTPKTPLQVVGNFIAGDYSNEASGTNIAVVWWHGNSSLWNYSFMWWWVFNIISVWWIQSAIIWGINNTIGLSGNNFIGWWQNNNIQGGFSAILMWLYNEINSNNSVIWWWRLNVINSWADYSVIAGWRSNKILSMSQSFIWGGYDNEVEWSYSFIWGGLSNDIVGWSDNSNVVWGYDNNIRDWSDHSSIVWGYWNNIYTAQKTFIWWWRSNTITGATDYSTIVGGRSNTINWAVNASIIWGKGNNILNWSDYSSIIGWNQNTIQKSLYSVAGWYKAIISWYDHTFIWNSSTTDFYADKAWSFLINVPNGGVGINTNNPTEALSVNWAISIWNTTTTTTGAIKFSWSNFFGYNWTSRVQLDN